MFRLAVAAAKKPRPELKATLDIAGIVDLTVQGTAKRLGFSVLFALFALMIAPWPVLTLWIGCLCVWEFGLRRAVDRYVRTLPLDNALHVYAATNFFGSR